MPFDALPAPDIPAPSTPLRHLRDWLHQDRVPSQCAICRRWPSSQVCQACIARFTPRPERCKLCALELAPDLSHQLRAPQHLCAECMRQAPPVDATFVSVSYGWPWSDLLTRYKFGDNPGWAPFLARQLLQTQGVRQALDDAGARGFLLPLPLSARRLETRGFNQAAELARCLLQQSHAPLRYDARLLLRIRDTQAQTELKRAARLANVKGAFAVEPLRAGELAGRPVVLVDDVMTSGASLFTAALALRAAGAKHITLLAFARTQ